MSTKSEAVRGALSATATTLDPHERAAVELLMNFNNGSIVEEPAWLDAFVSSRSRPGSRAYVRWGRLAQALDEDPELAEEVLDAVRPYSTSERAIMRVAADLATDRWGAHSFDHSTREEVMGAVEFALLGKRRGGGGVTNSIGGVYGGSVIQAGMGDITFG